MTQIKMIHNVIGMIYLCSVWEISFAGMEIVFKNFTKHIMTFIGRFSVVIDISVKSKEVALFWNIKPRFRKVNTTIINILTNITLLL